MRPSKVFRFIPLLLAAFLLIVTLACVEQMQEAEKAQLDEEWCAEPIIVGGAFRTWKWQPCSAPALVIGSANAGPGAFESR